MGIFQKDYVPEGFSPQVPAPPTGPTKSPAPPGLFPPPSAADKPPAGPKRTHNRPQGPNTPDQLGGLGVGASWPHRRLSSFLEPPRSPARWPLVQTPLQGKEAQGGTPTCLKPHSRLTSELRFGPAAL